MLGARLTLGHLWCERGELWDVPGTRGQAEQEAHRLRQRSPSRGDAADVGDEERPQDDEGEPGAGEQQVRVLRVGSCSRGCGCRRRTS